MVILIGAESATGKTLMAQNLLETYKIPYLSADHLKMGLYRANNNCGFNPSDGNAVIEKHLFPVIKGIVDTNIENKQSIIIEGCYIFPNRIKEFSSEHRKQIISVFMGFSREYIERNFRTGVQKYRNVIEERGYSDDRTIEYFIEANEKFKAMCIESDVRYFEIDNDYIADVAKIYKWIESEIEKGRDD